MQKEQNDTASIEVIHRRIMGICGDRVMLDLHLAELYGVETKQLKRAVRRRGEEK
jgi:ORF6N domain